jgi:hypothetical protein
MNNFTLFPIRPNVDLGHDDQCACGDCFNERSRRNRAAKLHARYIKCKICGDTVRVNGKGPLTPRRAKAYARHAQDSHPDRV